MGGFRDREGFSGLGKVLNMTLIHGWHVVVQFCSSPSLMGRRALDGQVQVLESGFARISC